MAAALRVTALPGGDSLKQIQPNLIPPNDDGQQIGWRSPTTLFWRDWVWIIKNLGIFFYLHR